MFELIVIGLDWSAVLCFYVSLFYIIFNSFFLANQRSSNEQESRFSSFSESRKFIFGIVKLTVAVEF